MTKDDHGPAFPSSHKNSCDGMSMRDWFAGQALVGLLEYPGLVNSVGNTAKLAYEYADAMLAERVKK